jgi:carboxyl-terminal processing protease
MFMRTIRFASSLLIPFVLLLTACEAIAPTPTPTPVPLSPPQHVESAFQWLETHAMLQDNVDWDALRRDTAGIIANANTTAETIPAICLALQHLQDGNAWLLIPGLEVPNFYTGYYTLYPEDKIIIQIDPASPAEKAGLRVGDVIEKIDGLPPKPAPDFAHYPPCNMEAIAANTQEHLTLLRNGEFVQVVVEKVKLTSGKDIYNRPNGRRSDAKASGIGYMELTLDSGHSQYPGDVQTIMRKLDQTPVCGWVIDLRRNSGGDIWSYIAAVGPILGEGELGGFVYLDGTREAWAYHAGKVFWNNEYRYESAVDGPIYKPKRVTPVALLASPATQAAAELVLVAFQGRMGVRTFGESTRGLPTLVTHTNLSDGSSVFVSGADSYDRDGKIYNSSISPDVTVATNWSQFGTAQDPVINAATGWLQSQSDCMS